MHGVLAQARFWFLNIYMFFSFQGADINEQDVEGRTPLMYAVQMNQMEAARLLVGKGCNISQKSCGKNYRGVPRACLPIIHSPFWQSAEIIVAFRFTTHSSSSSCSCRRLDGVAPCGFLRNQRNGHVPAHQRGQSPNRG